MPNENPPPLAEIQDWLRWVITEPRGVERALATTPGPKDLCRRPEPSLRRLSWIAHVPPISPPRRLGVYSNAYFARLLDALGADFKAVRRALGEADFRNLAARYLSRNPSTSRNIGDLGEAFSGFIAADPIAGRFPFLADLARLEWAALRCLSTDRLPPFDAEAAKDAPPEAWTKARLRLDSTVVLLDLEWPVDKLWARRDLPEKSGARRLSQPASRSLMVHRDDDWVQVTLLRTQERRALGMIRDGLPLEAVAMAEASQDEFHVQTWFSALVRRGVVKEIRFDHSG